MEPGYSSLMLRGVEIIQPTIKPWFSTIELYAISFWHNIPDTPCSSLPWNLFVCRSSAEDSPSSHVLHPSLLPFFPSLWWIGIPNSPCMIICISLPSVKQTASVVQILISGSRSATSKKKARSCVYRHLYLWEWGLKRPAAPLIRRPTVAQRGVIRRSEDWVCFCLHLEENIVSISKCDLNLSVFFVSPQKIVTTVFTQKCYVCWIQETGKQTWQWTQYDWKQWGPRKSEAHVKWL